MLHSIRPTRIRWQVAPALGLFSRAIEKVLTQSFVWPINREDGTTDTYAKV
jgi:hypothetical protein